MAKKDSQEAPTPDPAIGAAALKQAQLGEEWLSFSKDQFATSQQRQTELDALTRRVTEQQLGLADEAATNARADRQRYETVFKPIEDKFIDEAKNYATPEKQEQAAAEARADITNAGAGIAGQRERQAAAMGIAPDSGRYAGIEREAELGMTLGTAGAENNARSAVRDKGMALEADLVNMGRGLPAQSMAEASAAGAAGGGALSATGAANDAFTRSIGIVGQGISGASQGYANQAQTLNGLYQGQLDAWRTQQQADATESAGWGSAIGTGLGLILRSDEDVKEDKEPIPDGAALDAVRNMPVEKWKYKDGVEDGGEHIGTYAQDFQEQTGKGDGKGIPVIDAIGITMKAVQDLASRVDQLAEAMEGDAPPATPPIAKKPAKAVNDNAPMGMAQPAYQSA